eukprot:CAMPEP_0206425250 /NCGR_PEP_ID=MMETSP0324_2-20121206/3685_1 /ASSEMBLY_ACC=CAM_ASM_000836 /TAXON_ID=2866 /ORGANISM="Crypthecodinium cohnii, Strain Seligo" /LENGTH=241 /DNA_ID=CAMNT_0053890007 /DNA_START=42 /DNA_END=765 /DNA_ORIENTATION=+
MVDSTGLWLVTGGCQVDLVDSNCITSPNFPQEYSNNEACSMQMADSTSRFMEVTHFDTEQGFDVITLDGQNYSGRSPGHLDGLRHNSTLSWRSDNATTGKGWRVCARDHRAHDLGAWVVVEGRCLVDPEDPSASRISDGPGAGYSRNDRCLMHLSGYPERHLNVLAFDVDSSSYLEIDAKRYNTSNSVAFDTINFNSSIIWRSADTIDPTLERKGWKICVGEGGSTGNHDETFWGSDTFKW